MRDLRRGKVALEHPEVMAVYNEDMGERLKRFDEWKFKLPSIINKHQ